MYSWDDVSYHVPKVKIDSFGDLLLVNCSIWHLIENTIPKLGNSCLLPDHVTTYFAWTASDSKAATRSNKKLTSCSEMPEYSAWLSDSVRSISLGQVAGSLEDASSSSFSSTLNSFRRSPKCTSMANLLKGNMSELGRAVPNDGSVMSGDIKFPSSTIFCCGHCVLRADSVRVLHWPTASSTSPCPSVVILSSNPTISSGFATMPPGKSGLVRRLVTIPTPINGSTLALFGNTTL